MIHYVLVCLLWAKPYTKLIETEVNEYAMADINQKFGDYQFEANVLEEKLNYVKITHLPTGFSTEANSSRDYQQKSYYLKLDLGENQASLDCDLRQKVQP